MLSWLIRHLPPNKMHIDIPRRCMMESNGPVPWQKRKGVLWNFVTRIIVRKWMDDALQRESTDVPSLRKNRDLVRTLAKKDGMDCI